MIDLWDLGASPSTKQSEMDKLGCGTELSGGQVTGQPPILVLGVLVPSKWMTALGASVLELAPSLGLIRSLLPRLRDGTRPSHPKPKPFSFLVPKPLPITGGGVTWWGWALPASPKMPSITQRFHIGLTCCLLFRKAGSFCPHPNRLHPASGK